MEDKQQLYDSSSKASILNYAKKLCNLTFSQIMEDCDDIRGVLDLEKNIYDSSFKKNKGSLGNIIETYWFGIVQNNNHAPDFPIVGVELKVSPFEYTKQKEIRAGERVVISMINFEEKHKYNLLDTILWSKMEQILFVFYERDRTKDRLNYIVRYVDIYNFPQKDILIIKNDYQKIITKIINGKAHEISEGDTMYLGACTKGANSSKLVKQQASNILAKPRAFCIKQPYVTYMLQTYFANKVEQQEELCESIISEEDLQNLHDTENNEESFESLIVNKINQYKGKTDKELCKLFNVPYTKNKAQWITLTYRMLGINSGQAEEFVKANISIKTTRLKSNGKALEPSPLPPMRFMDLYNEEDWEDSVLYNQLSTLKYLFAVYRDDGKNCILLGSKLWNMPVNDLEKSKLVWERTKQVLDDGVKFKIKTDKKGNKSVSNNLPGIGDSDTIHVRPHTSKRYYKFADGTIIGNGTTEANGDLLPDGQIITRQSFWFNPSYITKILSDVIK